MHNAVGCDRSPEGDAVNPLAPNVAGHDLGVQGARDWADQNGFGESGWVNPLEDSGRFGHGFDDFRFGPDGEPTIFEAKGGAGEINGDQMQPRWVEDVLDRMDKAQPWNPWNKIIRDHFENGDLGGVIVKTPWDGDQVIIGPFPIQK